MVKNSDYLRELPRLPLHTEDWDGTGAQQPVIFEEVFAEQAAPVSPLRASFPSAPVVATAGTTATATAGQSPQSSSNSNSNSSSSTSVTISLSSSTTGVKTAASAVDGKSPAAARPVNTPSQKSSPSTTTSGVEQSHSSAPGSPAAGASGTGSKQQSAAAVETVSCASQVPLSKAVLSTMRAQRSSTSSISSLGPSKKYTMQKGESRAKQAETRVSGLTGYRKITEVPDGFGTTLLTELGEPPIALLMLHIVQYSYLYAFRYSAHSTRSFRYSQISSSAGCRRKFNRLCEARPKIHCQQLRSFGGLLVLEPLRQCCCPPPAAAASNIFGAHELVVAAGDVEVRGN